MKRLQVKTTLNPRQDREVVWVDDEKIQVICENASSVTILADGRVFAIIKGKHRANTLRRLGYDPNARYVEPGEEVERVEEAEILSGGEAAKELLSHGTNDIHARTDSKIDG